MKKVRLDDCRPMSDTTYTSTIDVKFSVNPERTEALVMKIYQELQKKARITQTGPYRTVVHNYRQTMSISFDGEKIVFTSRSKEVRDAFVKMILARTEPD